MMLVAYGLLTISWVFANAPFAAPDEAIHYIRALGVGRGTLVGTPARTVDPGLSPKGLAWVNQASRAIQIPPGMSPAPYACESPQHADVSAACMNHIKEPETTHPEITQVGTYQPLPYILPGLALRLSSKASVALRLGRLVNAAVFSLYFGSALFLLSRGSDDLSWVVGILLGTTPMVIFCAASLQPSGPEIGSAVLLTAGLVRLAGTDKPTRGTWLAIGAGGAALALTRSVGPVWLIGILLITFLWIGRDQLLRLARRFPVQMGATFGVLLVAMLLNRAWESAYGPTVVYNRPSRALLATSFGQFSGVYRQEIGVFGYLETAMSELAYKVWTIALTALLGLALLAGTRRERRALLITIAANGVIPALFFAVVLYPTGFGVQGRHVLPFAVALPLLAGQTLVHNRDRLRRLRPRYLVTYAAIIAAGVQLAGWYANARRHAVGVKGPIVFFGRSQWSPPLGYSVWAVTALIGSLFLVAAGLLADRIEAATPNHLEPAEPAGLVGARSER